MRRIAPGHAVAGRTHRTHDRPREEDVMTRSRPARTNVSIWIVITVLFAAALIGTLWVPFYNHLTPVLGGFPFFYWYQLMWVVIVAILAAVAYLLSKLAQRGNAASARSPDKGPGEAG
jgi:magnesium-transporting ATPase (P-type)